jgi:hypothetical protein
MVWRLIDYSFCEAAYAGAFAEIVPGARQDRELDIWLDLQLLSGLPELFDVSCCSLQAIGTLQVIELS